MSHSQGAARSAQTYEDYNVPAIFRPFAEEVLAYAKPRPGERILDLACGTGIVARLIAQQLCGDATVVGLDLNPAMIEVAKAKADHEGVTVAWRVGSAQELPFPDASFDLVLIQQGLQFFPDRVGAMREVSRVLAPGGRVVTATWTDLARHPFNQATSEAVERHLGTAALATPFALGSRTELEAVFTAAGFDSVEITVVQRVVRFPSPERYIETSITGAAAALPALQTMEPATLARLVEAVRRDVRELVEQHTEGDELVHPREAHIAIAYKKEP